jgi:hypothetical protein
MADTEGSEIHTGELEEAIKVEVSQQQRLRRVVTSHWGYTHW